jgi:tetratricopeptide (TPR) repeat protein
MALVIGTGVTAWRLRLIDGRLVLLAAAVWLVIGAVATPSLLYEHLGFLDRHVFHDYGKARLRYRKAVDTGKATPQALCALASLSFSEGDATEAVILLKEAVIERPNDPHLLALMSKALSRTGRHGEAVAAALRCKEMKGKKPLCDVALADALKAKGEDLGAAAAYQKALDKNPKLAGCRVNLADLYFSMGQVDASEREIQEALKTAPDNPDALYWAGKVAAAKGDIAVARSYLQSALEVRPVDDHSLLVPYQDVVAALSEATGPSASRISRRSREPTATPEAPSPRSP